MAWPYFRDNGPSQVGPSARAGCQWQSGTGVFSYLALILAPVVQESICILKTTFDEKVYTIKSDETNLLGYECNDTYRNHLHR